MNARCPNTEIGVIYEYDFGAGWMIHITMDRKELISVQPASNVPIMVPGMSTGATPVEDHEEVPGEREARYKSIAPMFFEPDIFTRYINCAASDVLERRGLKYTTFRSSFG
ncbi:hypothetical protein B0H19DRAFT_426355 [Mycena capillaripes]|nr:hypothetical protein B0H19DRAFT_426355 [Mycena capillaripes]